MTEALLVFESLMDRPRLTDSPFSLVFSKKDELSAMLQRSPIKSFYPEYEGPAEDVNCVVEFIHKRFLDIADRAGMRNVQVFIANLRDTFSMKSTLADLFDLASQGQSEA